MLNIWPIIPLSFPTCLFVLFLLQTVQNVVSLSQFIPSSFFQHSIDCMDISATLRPKTEYTLLFLSTVLKKVKILVLKS